MLLVLAISRRSFFVPTRYTVGAAACAAMKPFSRAWFHYDIVSQQQRAQKPRCRLPPGRTIEPSYPGHNGVHGHLVGDVETEENSIPSNVT
ncbi:hypothetical protein LIA77_00526 [Sarocladium implicatum]|nr:hypothetical protein LIA77_00526 [Sarocladium implicatum]